MQDLFLLRQDEIIKSVRLQQNNSEMLWSKYFFVLLHLCFWTIDSALESYQITSKN